MVRTEPGQALSKLGDKLMYLRFTWPFRWAHKPLCERHRHNVFQVGQLHLCRGCSSLWAGALLSMWPAWQMLRAITESNSSQMDQSVWLATTLALSGLVLAALSHPSLYRRLSIGSSRTLKDLLRFSSGAWIACFLAALLEHPLACGLASIPVLCVALYVRKVRNHSRQQLCLGCSEFQPDTPGICSGYSFQAQQLRAWERNYAKRVATRWRPKR